MSPEILPLLVVTEECRTTWWNINDEVSELEMGYISRHVTYVLAFEANTSLVEHERENFMEEQALLKQKR